MGDEPKRPHYIPRKEREQSALLRAVADLVKALADAAPKIDHSCRIVKKQ